MKNKNWKQTEEVNKAISEENLKQGRFRANDGLRWGAARLLKNFQEEIEIGKLSP